MQIRLGYELVYSFPQPTPMILALSIHYSRASDVIIPDYLTTDPAVPVGGYRDGFGNWCTRIVAPGGRIRIKTDALIRDSGLLDEVDWTAFQHDPTELPTATLQFLLPSRYCEVDSELLPLAWSRFGGVPPGTARVQAICDFVHSHLKFNYQTARPTRTALDGYREQEGVCRDFTHLAITLCRCMNIPARYTTGYLGDIGVPPVPGPMDFSAWFEVFLGDRWYTFDARHNRRRIGRIVMARGRDAGDVPITMCFGPSTLLRFDVVTDEVVEPKTAAVAA